MKTKTIFSIIIALLISFSIQSQVVVANSKSVIPTFEKTKKKSPTKTTMKKGQTKDLHFYVFKDNAYTFDIEAAKKLGKINFRIINSEGEVLFDNALAGYATSATLYADETQRITISFTTQPPKIFQSNKKTYDVKIKVNYKRNSSV